MIVMVTCVPVSMFRPFVRIVLFHDVCIFKYVWDVCKKSKNEYSMVEGI